MLHDNITSNITTYNTISAITVINLYFVLKTSAQNKKKLKHKFKFFFTWDLGECDVFRNDEKLKRLPQCHIHQILLYMVKTHIYDSLYYYTYTYS